LFPVELLKAFFTCRENELRRKVTVYWIKQPAPRNQRKLRRIRKSHSDINT